MESAAIPALNHAQTMGDSNCVECTICIEQLVSFGSRNAKTAASQHQQSEREQPAQFQGLGIRLV